MQSTFYALLARLLPTATVDVAVRGLTKFAAALAAAEAAQVEKAAALSAEIAAKQNELEAAQEEAARARRVADRVAEFTA